MFTGLGERDCDTVGAKHLLRLHQRRYQCIPVLARVVIRVVQYTQPDKQCARSQR